MPRENIQEAANAHYARRFDDEMRALIECANYDRKTAECEGETLDHEQARDRLEEGPLSFERLITDHRHESIQWEILLSTGGPASRVLVSTDYDGHIESAVYQFQDWFQPWTAAEDQDEELVKEYASLVGFYEVEAER